MALIKCPDCEADVSDSAAACIRCGRPMQNAARPAGRSVERGNTASRAKQDLGNAIGGLGFGIGVLVMIFGSLWVGLLFAFATVALGLSINYGGAPVEER